MIDEARTKGAKVHFASLMDICHLKNAELETNAPKIQRSSCVPSFFVKDYSGSYAVFTEQGSSASQMTAAKVMDIISRLPRCAGQAADAVSAFTQVKMEGAHSPFLLSEIFTVILWQDCFWERQFEKVLLEYGWEKVSNWECLFGAP